MIVVGGGWGGLATGALLARRGVRVLLLESRSSLGGRASYEERDGFLVDYGIHAHRFGAKGVAARVYRELGETLDLVEPGPGVLFHRGESLPAPRKPIDFVRTRLLSPMGKLATGRAIARLAARPPGENYGRTVAELLPGGLDSEARFMISALAGLGLISPDLSETSAGEFIWCLREAARSGKLFAFPRGGCRQHVALLGGIIRENGEVRTGYRVERLLVKNGSVTGVEGKEEVVRSRAVVAALPLPDVAGLLPPGTLKPSLEGRMKGIRPTAGLSWDVGLSKPVTDIHFVFSTDPLVIGSFNSNFDPGICPPGKQFSTWCRLLPLSAFESQGALRSEEGDLRSRVFHMFPGLEENIEWERTLRMPVIDGAVPWASQPWPSRPAPDGSGVPGLFFAGDTVGVPGQGGDIAFRSAIECSGAVLSHLD